MAFWAADRAAVERVAEVVGGTGAARSGPKDRPYGPGSVAAYLTDPAGNRFEVYHGPPL